MDADIGSFAVYFALLILVLLSCFFSLSETAFSALNRIRIKNMAKKGSKKAKLALELFDDFDRLLSSVLVGSNISNLSAAAICTVLFVNNFGDIGATLSTIFLTVVIVVFAEVTPKTLAKESPERYALLCAPILKFFVVLLTPINVFFSLWKKGLLRLVKTNASEQVMTEDELLSIVDEAEHIGVIDEADKELIHNVIEFYHQRAEDILTPRIDMKTISKEATTNEIAALFLESGFSRIPIYDKSIDNIVGIIHMRDFLRYIVKKGTPFESIITPPVFASAKMDIGDLFKFLQEEKSHMAIVIDEYGGTDGIVTMEDILEELMGEIWDEYDKVIESFVSIGENKHRVMCSADTHAFFEYFGLPEDDSKERPPTINGWLSEELGKIPEKGDSFNYKHLTITVHRADRKKALECIVTVEVSESVGVT